jgi:hypothetical protein
MAKEIDLPLTPGVGRERGRLGSVLGAGTGGVVSAVVSGLVAVGGIAGGAVSVARGGITVSVLSSARLEAIAKPIPPKINHGKER